MTKSDSVVKFLLLVFLIFMVLGGGWFIYALKAPGTEETFKIKHIYSMPTTISLAFDLSYITQQHVVLEGGTYGGILVQQSPEEINKMIPGLEDYKEEKNSVLWVYNFEPVEVTKIKMFLSDGWLNIKGQKRQTNQCYFVLIPRSFAGHSEQIICSEVTD